MNDDVNCPYCDEPQEINHDDGYGYEEDKINQQRCHDCGKIFIYTTSISFSYEANKADCLNGSPHDWKPTTTYPRFAAKMCCQLCGEYRNPTDDEKKAHNIPSRKEYYKELGIIDNA